ncbi:UNVERIFIED_CONTAM: hypothetical protein FKN15_044874 [Acipenser sinensis]
MPGFYPCETCEASLPVEDKHGRCSSCLSPEHAKEALDNRSICEVCAPFSKRMLQRRLYLSSKSALRPLLLLNALPHHSHSSRRKVAASSPQGSVPRESGRLKLCLSFPSPAEEEEDSEQMEKLWAAVSHQGTILAELLQEHSSPPALPVNLGPHRSASADWPQEDILSIFASEEVGEQDPLSRFS